MKFKNPITVYCGGFAAIGLLVCAWILLSEGIVFPLGLALIFFFGGSLLSALVMISDTIWGNQIRWVSSAYRSTAASKKDIDRDLRNGRRILIIVCVVSALFAIPVLIETRGAIQI